MRISGARTFSSVVWAITMVCLLSLCSCKKSDDEAPPQELQFTFEIVDHITGTGRTMVKAGFANASMTVTAAETEISGVVPGYLSIQDPSTGEILGSGNGSMSFPTGTKTNLRAIRFHDGDGLKEIYDWLVANNIRLYAGRESNWGRKDEPGVTGNEAVWTDVFSQTNNVLQTPFKLGSVSTGGNQNWYGFKIDGDGGQDLSQRWIYVNPKSQNGFDQVRTGLSELVEYLGAFDNVLDRPSQMVICDDQSNVLNDKGKAAIRFIFAYCK